MQIRSVHIDWIGSSHHLYDAKWDERVALEYANRELPKVIRNYDEIFGTGDWSWGYGRAPYTGGYSEKNRHAYFWCGSHETCCIEHAGVACQWLRDNGFELAYLADVKERLTKLEIAIDIETDESPKAFSERFQNNRIKSVSHMQSATGETVYFGSRKSDRFTKIYRYNEPHPRANLLRVEFSLKKEHARVAANWIIQAGVSYTAQSLINYYKIEGVPSVEAHNETLPAPRNDRGEASTIRWLLTQVAPAVRRLISEGVIENPYEFFEQNFMPEEVIDMDGNSQKEMF